MRLSTSFTYLAEKIVSDGCGNFRKTVSDGRIHHLRFKRRFSFAEKIGFVMSNLWNAMDF